MAKSILNDAVHGILTNEASGVLLENLVKDIFDFNTELNEPMSHESVSNTINLTENQNSVHLS